MSHEVLEVGKKELRGFNVGGGSCTRLKLPHLRRAPFRAWSTHSSATHGLSQLLEIQTTLELEPIRVGSELRVSFSIAFSGVPLGTVVCAIWEEGAMHVAASLGAASGFGGLIGHPSSSLR